MHFKRSDIDNMKALKYVFMQSKIELKGDAIKRVASLLTWFDELENKITISIKQEEINNGEIKKIKKQVAK